MRVVIVEDSGLLRDALTRLLTDFDVEVAAAVATPEELLGAAEEHKPDVFVVDVRLPPTFTDEGVHAAAELRSRDPEAKVLLLSQAVEERYARELLAQRSEGLGYLLKDRVADIPEFIGALKRVAGGGTALDPEVVAQLLTRRRRDPLADLTPREHEVLAAMAEGRSNAAIGRALVISDGAVEKHIRNIFTKLGLPPDDDQHRRVMAVITFLSR